MRNIFIIDAVIADANGTFNHLQDYPKTFDSNSYGGDIAKARKRAEGDMSEAWGAMCKRDDRLIQTVTMTNIYGELLERKSMGAFPADEPKAASEEE
jgi:hypothetical protein